MITTTLKLNRCYLHKELFGQTNVLFMVDLDIIAEDSSNNQITVITKKAAVSNFTEGLPFTPFSELTETKILEWVTTFYSESVIEQWKQEAVDQLKDKVSVKFLK